MAVSWLINGGDPNHLLNGMILQAIYSSSIEDGHRQSEQKDKFQKMEQQNKEGNFHGDNAERQRRHSETNELKTKGRQSEYVSDTHLSRRTQPAGHDSGGHTNSCMKRTPFKSSTNLSRSFAVRSRLGVPSALSFAHGAALSTAHTNLGTTAHGGAQKRLQRSETAFSK